MDELGGQLVHLDFSRFGLFKLVCGDREVESRVFSRGLSRLNPGGP